MRKRSIKTRTRATCAALALAFSAVPGYGQEVTWTHTQISTANGSMPSIAVDGLGYVHVGWTLNMGGSSWWAYHVDNQSGEYVQTLVDSKSSSNQAIFPFLSTDSLGFFHLIWRDLGHNDTVIYRTNNPLTRALVKKSFRGGHTHDPIMDITSDDVAHVITEADSCSGCSPGSNLYDEGYAATADRAGPVISLPQDTNDTTGVQQFSSAVTPDGARHLVFSMRLAPPADNQRLIYYSTRSAGSMTWSTPVSITGHEDNFQGWPAIVADAEGTLHVVYSSGDYGIYYVNDAAGTWSAPLRINDQNEVIDAIPSIAIDPNGRLHVAFQRFTPITGGTRISLHYTTNAYDAENWLDPASEVLAEIDSDFQLTHQNRKIAINWVDNQVLIPYQAESAIWLASTGDVPVTPPDPEGTSTLLMGAEFVPPVQLVRTTSNTSAAATTALELALSDAGDDGVETRVRELHVNVGSAQSRPRVLTKDEGLSYLLGGAELVTDTGQSIAGIVSDNKIVFRDTETGLWVPDGATRTYALRIWTKNDPAMTGKLIELRIKPDQDVVMEAGGSAMLTDQPVVHGDVLTIVDALTDCPEGAACNDGNACTFGDTCDAEGSCTGAAVSCESDGCNTRTCNGTASCTVVAVPEPCGEVDECALGTHDCSVNASCADTLAGFSCSCHTGYAGDGVTCNDVNECELAQSVCDPNATCDNMPGGFTCTCNAGYTGAEDGSCIAVPLPSSGTAPPTPEPPPPNLPPPPTSTAEPSAPPSPPPTSTAEPSAPPSPSGQEGTNDAPGAAPDVPATSPAAGCSVTGTPASNGERMASFVLLMGSLLRILRRRAA